MGDRYARIYTYIYWFRQVKKMMHKNLFTYFIAVAVALCSTLSPALAVDKGLVPLKEGRHTSWFGRLDLSDAVDRSKQNYAENLYKALCRL